MCYMTRQLLPSPSEGALIRAGGAAEPSAPLPVWAAERSPGRGETRLETDPCPLGALLLPPSGDGKLRVRLPHRNAASAQRQRAWTRLAEGSSRFVCPRMRLRGSGVWDVLLEVLLGALFNSSASLERKSEKLYYQQDL